MIKPVILLTVYRRYKELELSLRQIKQRIGEFKIQPDVVVVLAAPEVGHLWFFQKLQQEGLIHHLLIRPKLIGGDGVSATTYTESRNIRLGLNFIKANYSHYEKFYALVQAADVNPKVGTYGMMDAFMHGESEEERNPKAFLYRWPNNCVQVDVWHTNLFCVILDDNYWPPISELGDQDVLEHKWGKELSSKRLPGIIKWLNYNNKYFVH